MRNGRSYCTGKVKFTDFGLATKAAHKISKRTGVKAQAYHCKECHVYHVGSFLGSHKKPKTKKSEIA